MTSNNFVYIELEADELNLSKSNSEQNNLSQRNILDQPTISHNRVKPC